tara:strand:+ start:138 stop:497 length:360 start_codon:yes stop_codon:yes gene_type:complete
MFKLTYIIAVMTTSTLLTKCEVEEINKKCDQLSRYCSTNISHVIIEPGPYKVDNNKINYMICENATMVHVLTDSMRVESIYALSRCDANPLPITEHSQYIKFKSAKIGPCCLIAVPNKK